MSEQLLDRFWSKVDLHGPDDCWPWTGCHARGGYGQIWVGQEMVGAHRVSYEIEFGSIPDGLFVCHHCDNPECVNPSHLFIGTQLDNRRDAVKKGRTARGSKSASAKLNEADVRFIRFWVSLGYLQREIAKCFNVGQTTISAIVTGQNWGWYERVEVEP